MQLAIVINDVTLAFLEVIQLGVSRAAVSGLAVSLQVVALDANAVTRLRIRAGRPVSLKVPRITYSSNGSHALEVAIVIDDLPLAFPIIVELGAIPIAVYGLAACFKIVAMALDVFAVLRVRAAKCASRQAITILISPNRRARTTVNAGDAAQLAVIIHNFAAAFVVVIELGIFPIAVCRWTTSFKIVAMLAHVLARLRVRAAGKARCNAVDSAASAAPQSAIVVNDVAATISYIAQLSALPMPSGILAIRHQDIIMEINVSAGLLIRTRRIRLCIGRNPQPHNAHCTDGPTS